MQPLFRTFHTLFLTAIATAVYYGAFHVNELAEVNKQLFGVDVAKYLLPATAIVLYGLVRYGRTISEKVLELMPVIVRRTVAGAKHIEGDWPLVVVNGKTGELTYYGFLTIGFASGQYVVSGTDWYPDGRHALDFQSMQSYQLHPTLHYWYQQGPRGMQRGYTFIEFFPRDRVALRHTGVFHDPAHPDVRFYARKLKYKWLQRRLRDTEPRRLAAKAFADEIMQRMPQMIGASVDADWG